MPEMLPRKPNLSAGTALDRQVELAADRLGDGEHRVPFVGGRVGHGARCGLFEDEPIMRPMSGASPVARASSSWPPRRGSDEA
jgi:hypothetical protein